MQTQREGSHLLISTKPSVLLTPSFCFGINDLGWCLCLLFSLYAILALLSRGLEFFVLFKTDFVLTRAYSGTRIKIHGTEFRIINDDTVEAVVQDPRGIARA